MTTTTASATSSEIRRSDSPAQGQASATPAEPVPYAAPAAERKPYVPLRERVNLRMIVFFLAVAALPLALAYSALDYFINQGVNRSGEYLLVDLKAIGNFPFDQQSGKLENVPKRYRELDGKKVKLQGYMWGHRSAGERGNEFQFVYDVNECCFKGPPQVQERVYAYAKGKSLKLFSQYQFAEITGVLHVRIIRDKDTGAIYSVYDLDVESTKPLSS
jgi:hypothetical protein